MKTAFDHMIASIAERVDGPQNPLATARYTKKAVEDWLWLGDLGPHALHACGLDLAEGEDSADWPAALALQDLGARFARIVAEPAYRVQPDKAARDRNLGRATMHLAPQWRYPLPPRGDFAEERGKPAMIVPVTMDAMGWTAQCLSLLQLGERDFRLNIADLIAIPLNGSRALSLTGYTGAVGSFESKPGEPLTLFGSGDAWLKTLLAQARHDCADTPPHLIEQLHMPFAAPGMLLVEPRAFEWRVCRTDCCMRGVKEILCTDNRKLAEWIDAEMRKKEPTPSMPVVRGPAEKLRVAA